MKQLGYFEIMALIAHQLETNFPNADRILELATELVAAKKRDGIA